MTRTAYRAVLGALLALTLGLAVAPPAVAGIFDTLLLHRVRNQIDGQLLDFTGNHGRDRRLWSASLCTRRDVYVYLPPCYNSALRYPVIFYLHGFGQDERSFLGFVPTIDARIRCGKLPPTIVVAVDGSLEGEPSFTRPASFYINANSGRFEDFLMCDVWNWAHENFPIRPEREAHVLAGASMGGGAAFNLGLRYRDRVGAVAGIFPPLNLRWLDCHCNYMGKFDPECWGWRTRLDRRSEVIASYLGGLVKIRIGMFIDPLFGFNNEAVARLSAENPIEHLDRYDVMMGELAMFVGYGGRDEFNIDAQIESFLYTARSRGIDVSVFYDPRAHHNTATAYEILPRLLDWLGERLAPYGPVADDKGTR
jgi:S-formylglutathione hydrolase FrmB